jgi:acetylornithine deacetylase/succinyl-diaminopimelate desuccinylase-like protein
VHPRYNHRVCYTGYETTVAKQHPAWITERSNKYVERSYQVLRGLGQDPAEWYWPGGTDGSIFCGAYGIPTIGYSSADMRQAHQPKEHVNIDNMLDCVEATPPCCATFTASILLSSPNNSVLFVINQIHADVILYSK